MSNGRQLQWTEENNLALVDAVILSQKDVLSGLFVGKNDEKWASVVEMVQIEWLPTGSKQLNVNGVRRQFSKLLHSHREKSDALSDVMLKKLTEYQELCDVKMGTELHKVQLVDAVGKRKIVSVGIKSGGIQVLAKKRVLNFKKRVLNSWTEGDRLLLIDATITFEKQKLADVSKFSKWKIVAEKLPYTVGTSCPEIRSEFGHMCYEFKRLKAKGAIPHCRITESIGGKLDEYYEVLSTHFVPLVENEEAECFDQFAVEDKTVSLGEFSDTPFVRSAVTAAENPDINIIESQKQHQFAVDEGQRAIIETSVLHPLLDMCILEKSDTKEYFSRTLKNLWDAKGIVLKLKEIISENKKKMRLSENTPPYDERIQALVAEQICLRVKEMSTSLRERIEELMKKDNQDLLDLVVKWSEAFLSTSKAQ